MLSETLVITLGTGGLEITSADAHEAGLLFFGYPQSRFIYFQCEGLFTGVYKSDALKNLFRKSCLKKQLAISLVSCKLALGWLSPTPSPEQLVHWTHLKSFDLHDLSVDFQIPGRILESWNKITITSTELISVIKELAVFGTQVQFELTPESFTIRTSCELGILEVRVDNYNLRAHNCLQIQYKTPVKNVYIIKYLLPLTNYGSMSQKLDIYLSAGKPLLITSPPADRQLHHTLCTSNVMES